MKFNDFKKKKEKLEDRKAEILSEYEEYKDKRLKRLTKNNKYVRKIIKLKNNMIDEENSALESKFSTEFRKLTEGMGKDPKKKFQDIKFKSKYGSDRELVVTSRGFGYQGRGKNAKYGNIVPRWIVKIVENKDKIRERIRKTYKDKYDEMIEKFEDELKLNKDLLKSGKTTIKSDNQVFYIKDIEEPTHSSNVFHIKKSKKEKYKVTVTGDIKFGWSGISLEEFLKTAYEVDYKELKNTFEKASKLGEKKQLQKAVDIVKNLNSANKVVENL